MFKEFILLVFERAPQIVLLNYQNCRAYQGPVDFNDIAGNTEDLNLKYLKGIDKALTYINLLITPLL